MLIFALSENSTSVSIYIYQPASFSAAVLASRRPLDHAPKTSMRAAIYTRYGGPEVLSLGDVARPEPGDEELLIETHAAEVTKADCEMRRFSFPVKWFWLPLRLAFGLYRCA
jgi:hypothetical protein